MNCDFDNKNTRVFEWVLREFLNINKEICLYSTAKSVLKIYIWYPSFMVLKRSWRPTVVNLELWEPTTQHVQKSSHQNDTMSYVNHNELHGMVYEDENLAEDLQGMGYDWTRYGWFW